MEKPMSIIYSTNEWAGAHCNGNCMAIITQNQTVIRTMIWCFQISSKCRRMSSCVDTSLYPGQDSSSSLAWDLLSVSFLNRWECASFWAWWTKKPVYKTNEAEKNMWILRPNNSRGSSHIVAPSLYEDSILSVQELVGWMQKGWMQKSSSRSSLCCAWISKWWFFLNDRTHRGIRELCLAVCRLNFL